MTATPTAAELKRRIANLKKRMATAERREASARPRVTNNAISGDMSALKKAETELEQFESRLWRSLGINPDGDLTAYLNESNFLLADQYSQLRERYSLELHRAAGTLYQ